MKSHFISRTLLVLCAISLIACQFSAHLVLAPESTVHRVVFMMFSAGSESKTGRRSEIQVYRCVEYPAPFPGSTERPRFPQLGEMIWGAKAVDESSAPSTGQFAYGEKLPGLVFTREPIDLEPGCYIAHAYAKFPYLQAGLLLFRISPTGKVSSDA